MLHRWMWQPFLECLDLDVATVPGVFRFGWDQLSIATPPGTY